MHRPVLLTIALIASFTAACASPAVPATSTPATGSPAAESAAPGAGAVSIVDFAFEPAQLSVKVGDTVTWTNEGSAPHTVKWSDDEPESDQLGSGDTYERTFDAAGSYPYVCGIHSQMEGTITVTE